MKLVYEFCGGKYDGQRMTRSEVMEIYNGYFSKDWTEERNAGALVPRAELDNQPHVSGYIGPMYDGERYIADGKEYHTFEYERLSDETKKTFNDVVEIIGVLRYETQDVYDMLSH